eukprot:g2732.t1
MSCPFHKEAKQKQQQKPGRGGFKVEYASYLKLDSHILAAQESMSGIAGVNGGKGAHDEHLFIIIHQSYELWFKQILHELDDVLSILKEDHVKERQIGVICHRLHRMTEIFRVLIDQLTILETMTPLDFLEFRDYLFPASGFQSFQFRLVENKLGLRRSQRLKYSGHEYCSYQPEDKRKALLEVEGQPTLFTCLERWLERTPFLQLGDYSFWDSYKHAVDSMLNRDRADIEAQAVDEDTLKDMLKEHDSNRAHFMSLFDEEKHAEAQKNGSRRMSYKAMQAALLISIFQDEPMLQSPARLLSLLVDIDELLTRWRSRHALMVHRMIGAKLGTGGSSGFYYLKATAQRHKIFTDIANLATYMIPRSLVPPLPANVQDALRFEFSSSSLRRRKRSMDDGEPSADKSKKVKVVS